MTTLKTHASSGKIRTGAKAGAGSSVGLKAQSRPAVQKTNPHQKSY